MENNEVEVKEEKTFTKEEMLALLKQANQQEIPAVVERPIYDKTTPIVDLKKYAAGSYVRLPDFGPDMPFIAKLRKPSMLTLVSKGSIPNSLMKTANELFAGGAASQTNNIADEGMLKDLNELIEIFCDAALVEPTYKELKENEIFLSDDQKLAIFNYIQGGVEALDSFR